MKPNSRSQKLLGVTRSKAKMYEYGVIDEHHIKLYKDPARLFTLTIGLLGELSARYNKKHQDMDSLSDLKKELQFAAHFFDSYIQTRLDPDLEPYLLLLGASSFYLCDLPGSSTVLAKRLDKCPDIGGSKLEELLLWLLKNQFDELVVNDSPYEELIREISRSFTSFWFNGKNKKKLECSSVHLRNEVYINGTPRELLLSDIIGAVIKKRIENSTWDCLPRYTNTPLSDWVKTFRKSSFIRELWPAQHLLGKSGIFSGKSGVVQMPTSAGKTKSIEIIIRASFLANRTSLAIIVAPFRALCHDIKNNLLESFSGEDISINELTDVPLYDFDLEDFLVGRQILIVTPEKLLYVLRHTPELSKEIGLLIYDEGHQFDNGLRGITYELLLTSLKAMILDETQTVLISAVISNAESIGDWLIGEESVTVTGSSLNPTYRTLAFASWLDPLGRLEFVSNSEPEKNDFFVPRIIETVELEKHGKEIKLRVFPERNNGQDVALYLGLKLISNGGVAVFAGKKSTATSIGKRVIDVFNRGLTSDKPKKFSDPDELRKLSYLIDRNLGADSIEAVCSKLGVYIHHGNIPQGIRLAIEYALKEGMTRFIICTSTLAQGVNLPIRYLIVTSLYQGSLKIKTRDFHNLMGRAGRAGMYTEGSIIFSDTKVYDKKQNRWEKWRWEQSKEVLNPEKSEPCVSTLFEIFEPLYSDDRKYIYETEPLDIVQKYYGSKDELGSLINEISNLDGFSKDDLNKQVNFKLNIVSAVESFIMTHWNDYQKGNEEAVIKLSEGTLAYHLGKKREKQQIVELFKFIAKNVDTHVANNEIKLAFSKTLYGLQKTSRIFKWINNNITSLLTCKNNNDLFEIVWPLIYEHIENNIFHKCDQPDTLKNICFQWLSGSTYSELYKMITASGSVLLGKKRNSKIKLEHLVEICDNAVSYEGSLILGAVIELLPLVKEEDIDDLINLLEMFQKKIKYGLPSRKAIIIYELGFSDRVLSIELDQTLDKVNIQKHQVIKEIKENVEAVKKLLENYPSYFQVILNQSIR